MKNRRLVILATLVAITLCLGIGFAAVTDVLTIGGTVRANGANTLSQWDLKVYFSNVTAPTVTHAIAGAVSPDEAVAPTATVDATTEDRITVTVPVGNLLTAGDTVKFTATVRNDSTNYNASTVLTTPTLSGAGAKYFNVTTDWGNTAKVIGMESSVDVVVTITLKETVVDTDTVSATFTMDFTATAVDPESGAEVDA